jgi:hypothetical protein
MPKINQEQDSRVTDPQDIKARIGAPDAPRKRKENYDGHEPLEHPGHEAAAWFIAVPKELRDFKSVAAFAEHFSITRKTAHLWMRDFDVQKRTEWLLSVNKISGNLAILRAFPQIMKKLVGLAMRGSIPAIKLCADIALREDKEQRKLPLRPLSLEEVLERAEQEHIRNCELMTPTWQKRRAKQLGYPDRSDNGHSVAVTDIAPEPNVAVEGAASVEEEVETCDACGNVKCAHGRCPACEVCKVCDNLE